MARPLTLSIGNGGWVRYDGGRSGVVLIRFTRSGDGFEARDVFFPGPVNPTRLRDLPLSGLEKLASNDPKIRAEIEGYQSVKVFGADATVTRFLTAEPAAAFLHGATSPPHHETWIEAALESAQLEAIDEGFFASVPDVHGPWGQGASPYLALKDLRDALEGWIELKIEDGDDDIPPVKGALAKIWW